jgi:hypothetical protein
MNGTNTHKPVHNEGGQYEIRIRGHLNARWAGLFEGLTLNLDDNGDTLIIGEVSDQAALFGLLRKARDAGMLLVSVQRVTASKVDACGDKS